jgi:UDP-GlcNAc:undecaprenyl-phosphate GlcNAc-1-phosphate transferase
MMLYFGPAIAIVLSLSLTPLVRALAIRRGAVATPMADRWHKKPTAMFGGIAIFLGFSISVLFQHDFSPLLSSGADNPIHTPLRFVAVVSLGASGLFVLGLLDDILSIKPQSKLIGQILVASMVALLGYRLMWFTSLTLDTMVTIVWIVGVTNAFNLIDNMDGLCAGVAAIAAMGLAALFWHSHPMAASCALALVGALAGFLLYNFNPASIFMGDCGSLPIGFILSMLSLYYPETGLGHTMARYAVPILILMVPILDTTLVSLIRVLSGRSASTGGKDHTSHRLVLIGFSEKSVVLFLYGIGGISAVAAYFVHSTDSLSSPAVIIPVVLALLLMGIYLAQLRIYPEKEFSVLRDKTFTPVLVELTYKRQLLLVVMDFGLIAFSYYLSYRLRFDYDAFIVFFKIFLQSLPAVIACKIAAFFALGVYRGIWGHMSSNDVYVALKASSIATLLTIAVVTFVYRFESFSKGIFVIDWLLTTAFLLGTRGSFRLFQDTLKRRNLSGERVLIYGAGRGGEILLRELHNNPQLQILPVGFLDDDPLKKGRKLLGYPIVGGLSELSHYLKNESISGLVLAFSKCSPAHMTNIRGTCRRHHLKLKRFTICVEEVNVEQIR